MVDFRALDELLTDEPKRLPVTVKDGKPVFMEFPGRVNAEQGLLLLRLSRESQGKSEADADKVAEQVIGTPERWEALETAVLGKPSQDFIADGLTQVKVQHIFQTLMAWHLYGEEVAGQVWDPPAPANRAAKRSAGRSPAADRRTSTASPASSTRKKTTRAKASGGTSSSSTGASSRPTSRTRASTSKTTS